MIYFMNRSIWIYREKIYITIYRYFMKYHFMRYIENYWNFSKVLIYHFSIYRDISQIWHIKTYQIMIYCDISRYITNYTDISKYIGSISRFLLIPSAFLAKIFEWTLVLISKINKKLFKLKINVLNEKVMCLKWKCNVLNFSKNWNSLWISKFYSVAM